MRLPLCAAIALLAACGSAERQVEPGRARAEAQSWWQWHDRKRAVDDAVSDAINTEGGGDYAQAVTILRASDRPPDVKSHQVGMLIIDGFEVAGAKRAPETLEQGLRMVEDATVMGGEMERHGPPQLRRIFERGAGVAPNAIPVAPDVAACWLAIEQRRNDDRAGCIALRRERLPKVG